MKDASSFWLGFTKRAALKPETALEPQQERVVRKLEKTPGLIVYHGLGSGKTITSLAATQGMKTDVVLPASLRGNYQKETAKHTVGHKPNIMSFEKAIKTPPSGEALVVDEAHGLGNSAAKRTQALLERAPLYKRRLLLTGTPIRNHPSELAPLLRIARGDKKAPLDESVFKQRFIEEVKHKPDFFARFFYNAQPGVSYRIKNRGEFKDLVDGYVDYHAPAKDHFPSVSHEVVESPMSEDQLHYYKFLLGKAGPALRYKIKKGMPPSKAESKQLNAFLTGVRQVSNTTAPFGGDGTSPKLERALGSFEARMKKDRNFKGVVYSNFLDGGLKAYAAELEKKKIPYAVFDGGLNDKERKRVVTDYNNGKIKALLLSGAGAQGLDLKGTKLVQLLEPHWNDSRLEQAMGRAIRYKSHSHLPEKERHVHVQRFHATVPPNWLQKIRGKPDTSVDQYLDMLSKKKQELNDQFLDVLKEVGK